MSRPKIDPVDRILDAWGSATPEQWKEAMRTICRVQALREGERTIISESPTVKRGRPATKKATAEAKAAEVSSV